MEIKRDIEDSKRNLNKRKIKIIGKDNIKKYTIILLIIINSI